MQLVCLGLSHQTAPAQVRERHAFPRARMTEALVALRDYEEVREAAILSTCGRLEIYAELHDEAAGVAQLKEFLVNFRHVSVPYDIEPYLYTLPGPLAAEHLMRVATGLDSMLIGEAEILGQVKDAYHLAAQARSLGKTLHGLFREALTAGKAARAQTAIGDESVSAATAAIALAKEHVGNLHGKSVLLIGAGKMGQTAGKRIKLEGAARLVVLNRTQERARELVAQLGMGHVAELPSLVAALKEADVVITSTGAAHFILAPGNVAEAMLARPDRPLLIVDLAVPRDADPEVARIPGVALADIDRLGAAVDMTLEKRREAIPSVEEIIAEHLERFERWYETRETVPVIASLSRKAEALRESEVLRLFARCPDLNDRQRMLITGMSLTIISKLLHSAMCKLRANALADHAQALAQMRLMQELFELQLEHHAAEPPVAAELLAAAMPLGSRA